MNHSNGDITRCVLNEVFQPVNAARDIDGVLHGFRGFEHLRLQVFSVHDQNDLVVVQIERVIHLADDKHHGERFARTLGMPERTAFFSLVASTQALDNFGCAAILHIAGNEFHTDTVVLIFIRNEVLNNIKEMGWLKHTGHSNLLCGGLAVGIDITQLVWIGVLPLHKMADTTGDAGIAAVMETGGHDNLIEIKQFRHALRLFSTSAVLIAHQLVDAFRHRFCDVRRLTFDNHERKTVHEQNDIGNDMLLFAGNANLILADGKEIVIGHIGTVIGIHIRPVDKTHRAVNFAGFFIVGRQSFRDAVVDFLVILKHLFQRMRIILHLPAEVIDLDIVQPRI